MKTIFDFLPLVTLFTLLTSVHTHAQWMTQSFTLEGGWNAIYLHVDSSHDTLDNLIRNDVSNPIQEVWLWAAPASVQQFVESPQAPSGGSQWVTWSRNDAAGTSALQRLSGNMACLVRVASSAGGYVWNVKGKPVPPRYQWTSTGLNFLGFPTPSVNPPSFEAYLAKAPGLAQTSEIFRYPGGELGLTNPVRVFALRATPVRRGEAFWMRTGTTFNGYFGPFDLELQSASGVHFRDAIGQYRLRLRNTSSSEVTVTLNLLASETPPTGQPAISQLPPLLVRGALNLTNLTYSFAGLNAGPQSWVLAAKGQPGSDVEVILGVNRSAMTGAGGTLYAGILRLTDSLSLSQIDLPVSAEVASQSGLWVGSASVASVGHYLKKFAQATNRVDFTNVLARLQLTNGVDGVSYVWDEASTRILIFGGSQNKSGSYVLDGPAKVDAGTVARPFPLRLILHNDGSTTRLLQQVYYGIGLDTNPVVATRQSLLLPSQLALARRITAVHLPESTTKRFWPMAGDMMQGSSLTTTVELAYDDQLANPFLHTYHPDHDNLDALFATPLPQGVESYGVRRQIKLNFNAPASDFDSLTAGTQTLNGNYAESVTFLARGSDTKQFQGLGAFTLKRISSIAALTQ